MEVKLKTSTSNLIIIILPLHGKPHGCALSYANQVQTELLTAYLQYPVLYRLSKVALNAVDKV